MDSRPSPADIEAWVQNRETAKAKTAISKRLRKAPTEADVLQAADWLRRLSLFGDALKVLELPSALAPSVSAHRFEGKRLLMAAWILNQLGASLTALYLAQRIRPATSHDHRVLAEIFGANFMHAQSEAHLRAMAAADPDADAYASRLGRIAWADALAGLKRFAEARALVATVRARSPEPLLRAICDQATAEYWTLEAQPQKSLKLLQQPSMQAILRGDTVDSGILHRWLGKSHGLLGQKQKSLEHFREARRIYRKLKLRPEAELALSIDQAALGFEKSDAPFRLFHYPGSSDAYREYIRQQLPGCDRDHRLGPKNADLVIVPAANEGAIGGKRFYGVPTELRLLAAVAIAGPLGLSLIRAKGFLWPTEVHGFALLEGRLNALITRLRAVYKMNLQRKQGVLYLASQDAKRIQVRLQSEVRPALVISSPRGFSRNQVESWYSLSPTRAKACLREWVGEGWVTARRNGRLVLYYATQG